MFTRNLLGKNMDRMHRRRTFIETCTVRSLEDKPKLYRSISAEGENDIQWNENSVEFRCTARNFH